MVFNDEGHVLLIKRGKEPHYGRWMVPGGTLEWGETLEAAAVREVREETGLEIEIDTLIDVIQAMTPGDSAFHFVIMHYLARPTGGTLRAGSDALEAAWVGEEAFGAHDLTAELQAVIAKAQVMARKRPTLAATGERPTPPRRGGAGKPRG